MKQKLKKNKLIMKIYYSIISIKWKIYYFISPTLLTKKLYKQNFKRNLDLKNPKTFNEKIMWLKLNYYKDDAKIKQCIDKYNVRNYILEKNLSDILNELYGVYNDPDDINFDMLPDRFVLKCNNGSGFNLIVKNKNELDIENTKQIMKKWLKSNYEIKYAEIQYKGIKKLIICEKYLEDDITDYKFFCFHGKPKFLYVSSGLGEKKCVKMQYYDLNLNSLNVKREGYISDTNPKLKKPKNFSKMIEIATRLSEDFPFVRVDLYNIDGKVYFSELTFVPTGGLMKIEPEKYDYIWGTYLNLNK